MIGAGSAPFAQPLGQIAGALLAGNGVAFKPAARAALAGERIGARARARRAARGARADRPRRRRRRHRAGQIAGRQDPLHRLARRRARGRRRGRRAREGGDGRVGRQGRDARARRRAPAAARSPGRCGPAAPAPGRRAAPSSAYTSRASCTSASSRGSSPRRARCAWAIRADPRIDVGPLASPRRLAHVQALVEDALAQGADAALRRARQPGRLRGRLLLRARRDHRRDARDGADARAARGTRARA